MGRILNLVLKQPFVEAWEHNLNIKLSTKSEIHEESSISYRVPLFFNKHDGADKNDNGGGGRCRR